MVGWPVRRRSIGGSVDCWINVEHTQIHTSAHNMLNARKNGENGHYDHRGWCVCVALIIASLKIYDLWESNGIVVLYSAVAHLR